MVTSIVVGGTRGIGSVIASNLIERGDDVYTVSRRTSSSKNHVSCDISSDCSKLTNSFSKVDYLIFAHRYRGDSWNETFEVTLRGVQNVIQAISGKLKSNSSVVIISSNASQFIVSEQPAHYHASRAALETLMKYYAVTYGKSSKVRFNCILPSSLIKPENLDFFSKNKKIKKLIEDITPLGRMGDANDIANIVEFLCSSKSSFLTGNCLMVDGGLSLVGQESIAREMIGLNHEK
jgi:3-oxoacyl-[acyl-carrier protein] reductase